MARAVLSPYKPLDPTLSEIRLLEILDDGSGVGKIQCQLHEVSLSSKLKFTALSYVWGDTCNKKEILVNGTTVAITSNLASALGWAMNHWSKRFPGRNKRELRLWADALCINQQDIYERNHQVKTMRDIYSLAELTLAVLQDEHDTGVSDGIRLHNQIYEVLTDQKNPLSPQDFSDWSWIQRIPSLCVGYKERYYPHNRGWHAISTLYTHQYWRRVWILQEAVVSQELLLITATESIEFPRLSKIHELLRNADTTAISKPVGMADGACGAWRNSSIGYLTKPGAPGDIADFRARRRDGNLELYIFYSGRTYLEASDPKDHIYGLLGLMNVDLSADYRKSVTEVYMDFIKEHIKLFHRWRLPPCRPEHPLEDPVGDSSFLLLSGLGYRRRGCARMPTWVPDFSSQSIWLESSDTARRDTYLFLQRNHDPGDEDQLQISRNTLFISGWLLQRITMAADIISQDSSESCHSDSSLASLARQLILNNQDGSPQASPTEPIIRLGAVGEGDLTKYLLLMGLAFVMEWVKPSSGPHRYPIERFFHPESKPAFDIDNEEEIIHWYLENTFPRWESICSYEGLVTCWEASGSQYRMACQSSNKDLKMFMLEDGSLGVGPREIRVGDVLFLPRASNGVVALRQIDDHYLNIGGCHIPYAVGADAGDLAERLSSSKKAKLTRIEIR
ncbi:putative heterokaryon incompatibility protein [Rosellinia necatrix]|uniref:Putative heterokaryon incompatibility protein n=1 Tax=Rosellinia necatrix TaxID=77044 RepID=A0A1W2TCY9_ROSNE|nr:putative heterokaryon incompatibility protein [Rosellinia necatrix]